MIRTNFKSLCFLLTFLLFLTLENPSWGRRNSTSAKSLVNELRSPDHLRRHQVKEQLRTYDYKEIAKAMAKFAKDPNPDIRILMAQTLGELGGSESVRRLRVLYTLEKVDRVRRAIFVQIAGNISKDQKGMTFFNRVATQDKNRELRHLALTELTILGKLKNMTKKVIKTCKKVWKEDSYEPIKLSAAITLIELGEDKPELWATLFDSLRNPSVTLRRRAALAIGGNKDPKVIKQLILAAQDPDPIVRANVSRSLSSTRNKAAIPVLKSLYTDSEDQVRESALTGLATFPIDLVGPHIYILGLKDQQPTIRTLSVRTLESLGEKSALKDIRDLSINDPDPKVRYISRKAAATLSN